MIQHCASSQRESPNSSHLRSPKSERTYFFCAARRRRNYVISKRCVKHFLGIRNKGTPRKYMYFARSLSIIILSLTAEAESCSKDNCAFEIVKNGGRNSLLHWFDEKNGRLGQQRPNSSLSLRFSIFRELSLIQRVSCDIFKDRKGVFFERQH